MTALHYASFVGNSKLIDLLINHGADIFCLTQNRMSMLHLAAIGD